MGSCAAPSAKGDDKFITTDYLQQCPFYSAYELSKLNEYLDKQDLDHGYYYTPENPVLWQSAQEDEL
ncbi:hypothetical protein [Escherichia coli]|uniref:hypothetical protein n=1 Tax=Escherichia coli TaxID=562 RepID=UPI000DD49276|nr:hypothetical protein [Escherichia coli]